MPIKVLVVLDDAFRFDTAGGGATDFTYLALTTALEGAGFEVTKAHRGTDSTATPGFQNFNFAAPPAGHALLDFDVIWLIGLAGRNVNSGFSDPNGLGAAQHNALAAYMEAGGGVFATGDHDSVGSNMSGRLPRIRVMRCWYGANDPAAPIQPQPAQLINFRRDDGGRADTVYQKLPADMPPSQYPPNVDGFNDYTWFENQSDRFPQTITPTTSPAHPILRHNDSDITVYPDHMHEGNTLGPLDAVTYNYTTTLSPFGDTAKPEFREIAGVREKPVVIATGQGGTHASRDSPGGGLLAPEGEAKTVNTLNAYDGRKAGVGRIVCGSTFHHYVDINLTGATSVTLSTDSQNEVGVDAMKGQGYNANPPVLEAITAVFVNITKWLARPRPAITLILERSTFSENEVIANPLFEHAVLVTVDGLKPSQFPGGGINALGNNPPGLAGWAPAITAAGSPIAFEPTRVDSDDPTNPDRVQRFTFTYRVHFTGPAFGFPDPVSSTVPVSASLTSAAAPAPLTDAAWIQLVKAANPFMLDLEDNNTTVWMSSDIKVFHVAEGQNFHGFVLPNGADAAAARSYIQNMASTITDAVFTSLPSAQEDSVLSSLPETTGMSPKKVYNFALARVRLAPGANADAVRVFFRIFTTQTTAALTYHLAAGMPVEGYLRTAGANPIALPGTHNGGSDWLSFPFFAAPRVAPPASQTDPSNVQQVVAADGFRIYGAFVDNNLATPYLPLTPGGGGGNVPLSQLMMGEHQCIVAQIEYAGAPIPDGAKPWTSDKLSQRNLAVHPVANPGLDGSRVAMHTFEIEATPHTPSEGFPPDELLLDWPAGAPEGTVVRIHIPSWRAQEVADLADRFYARHEISVIDAHTIELPAGGMRYVPLPRSVMRQNGVISAEFPLGIRKGQRFDVSVRQITNRSRQARLPESKAHDISLAEAAKLLAAVPGAKGARSARAAGAAPAVARGAFPLGPNKVLVTDLSLLCATGDHAVVIEHPEPAVIAAAMRDAGQWRETIGAFQLGVPVSTREAMLLYQMRLLSVMRWRTAHLPRNSRWRATMVHYVSLLVEKVQALGGNPWAVPATPDGNIPQVHGGTGTGDGDGGGGPGNGTGGTGAQGEVGAAIEVLIRRLNTPGCLLLLIVLVLLLAWLLAKLL